MPEQVRSAERPSELASGLTDLLVVFLTQHSVLTQGTKEEIGLLLQALMPSLERFRVRDEGTIVRCSVLLVDFFPRFLKDLIRRFEFADEIVVQSE